MRTWQYHVWPARKILIFECAAMFCMEYFPLKNVRFLRWLSPYASIFKSRWPNDTCTATAWWLLVQLLHVNVVEIQNPWTGSLWTSMVWGAWQVCFEIQCFELAAGSIGLCNLYCIKLGIKRDQKSKISSFLIARHRSHSVPTKDWLPQAILAATYNSSLYRCTVVRSNWFLHT